VSETLLEIADLTKHFGGGFLGGRRPVVHAVNGVAFHVAAGETLALIGESGCGQTTLARTVARLLTADAGSIAFRNEDVTRIRGRALKRFRRQVQMIFQDPYASLDPRLAAGAIVAEPLAIHGIGTAPSRRDRVAGLLEAVGLKASDMTRYPHEFSGGQRQRIGIARALALDPSLVIADEPVSALDVSVQSQVLNLMRDLGRERGLAYLFITHDLAVVSFVADRVAVMYLGEIVELADRDALFRDPRHPYTKVLMRAVPVPGRGKRRERTQLEGEVPTPTAIPPGCPFHPRCPRAEAICAREKPAFAPVAGRPDRHAACHFRDEAG